MASLLEVDSYYEIPLVTQYRNSRHAEAFKAIADQDPHVVPPHASQ
jgi:hypothetical protein